MFGWLFYNSAYFQLRVLKPDQPIGEGSMPSQFLNSLHNFQKRKRIKIKQVITVRKSKERSIDFPSHDSLRFVSYYPKVSGEEIGIFRNALPAQFWVIRVYTFLTKLPKKMKERYFHALCCSYVSTYHHNHNCESKSFS